MALNHVVYFKFKDSAKPDEIEKHMVVFEEIAQTILGVSRVQQAKLSMFLMRIREISTVCIA